MFRISSVCFPLFGDILGCELYLNRKLSSTSINFNSQLFPSFILPQPLPSFLKILNVHDYPNIYHVPIALYEQGLVQLVGSRLNLKMEIEKPRKFMNDWRRLAEKVTHLRRVRTKENDDPLAGKKIFLDLSGELQMEIMYS